MNLKKKLSTAISTAFLMSVIGGAAGCENELPPLKTEGASKPNIIFIMTDDMGWGDTSLNSHISGIEPRAKTPNIQSLAENGVNFTSAYTTAPVCAPARAAFLSSFHTARMGMDNNNLARAAQNDLPAANMGILLQSAGYRTGAVGKWDLGGSIGVTTPTGRGFDSFFGFFGAENSFYPTNAPDDARHLPRGGAFNRETLLGGPVTEVGGYNVRKFNPATGQYDSVIDPLHLTDAFTREAIAFIDQYDKDDPQPFFLYLSYHAPRYIFQVPDKYYQMYSHLSNPWERIHTAMIHQLDAGIGRLIERLDYKGILDNTLIVLSSDNGACRRWFPGPDNPTPGSNGGLRGHKWDLFEGGIRIPFVIRWPGGNYPANVDFHYPVSHKDLLPTFLGAAGFTAEEIEGYDFCGRDLTPFVTGVKEGAVHEALYWRFPYCNAEPVLARAVRAGDYKLLINFNYRTGRLDRYLFNLSTNRNERDEGNLIDNPDYAALLERLRGMLAGWEDRMAPLPQNLAFDMDGNRIEQLDARGRTNLLLRGITDPSAPPGPNDFTRISASSAQQPVNRVRQYDSITAWFPIEAGYADSETAHWIRFDFAEPVLIDEIRLSDRPTAANTDSVRIEFSDGGTPITVDPFVSNTPEPGTGLAANMVYNDIVFEPRLVDWVKIYITRSSGGTPGFAFVQIMG